PASPSEARPARPLPVEPGSEQEQIFEEPPATPPLLEALVPCAPEWPDVPAPPAPLPPPAPRSHVAPRVCAAAGQYVGHCWVTPLSGSAHMRGQIPPRCMMGWKVLPLSVERPAVNLSVNSLPQA